MNWHSSFRIDGADPRQWISQNEGKFPQVVAFLRLWKSGQEDFQMKTSGSTGSPKDIDLKRSLLEHSAKMTGNFFGLEANDRVLLCLPPEFIAGKMMLVRAMVLGLNIQISHAQVASILNQVGDYSFVAMTTLQVAKVLDLNVHFFTGVKQLLIGGGPVDIDLKRKLNQLNIQAYSSYGMTETASHIAVANLAQQEVLFTGLNQVSFSTDANNCLVIHAPEYGFTELRTNDVVDLRNSNSFKWLGRYDNVINSGGYKIHPEEVEQLLSDVITANFFVAGVPHAQLGQQLILVLEGEFNAEDQLFERLHPYQRPKEIKHVAAFIRTLTGKVDRNKTMELILG